MSNDSQSQHSEASPEGWGFPDSSRKAHYFVDSEALCGRWWYRGALTNNQSEAKSPDDCAACYRKLQARAKP